MSGLGLPAGQKAWCHGMADTLGGRAQLGFRKHGTPQVTAFLLYLQIQVQQIFVQSSQEQLSPEKNQNVQPSVDRSGTPLRGQAPQPAIGMDLGWRRSAKASVHRGWRRPRAGVQPFFPGRAETSFPRWQRLLENRKSREQESGGACLRPGRADSSLSGSPGPRACRLQGGVGPAVSGPRARPAPRAGEGRAAPQHPGRAWRRLGPAASAGLRSRGQRSPRPRRGWGAPRWSLPSCAGPAELAEGREPAVRAGEAGARAFARSSVTGALPSRGGRPGRGRGSSTSLAAA